MMDAGDSLVENVLKSDLYTEEDYGDLDSVANWALKEARNSDDDEIISRAKNIMTQTQSYLETEYSRSKFSLDTEIDIDGEYARDIIRNEMEDKAHGRFEPWNELDDIRYEIDRLLEYKED